MYSVIEPGPATLELSVVVPVKDEVENVAELAGEISAALDAAPWAWECVWVDDGSTDGTAGALARVAGADRRHRVVTLAGNFGQSAAMAAGFSSARGELLATLDGDGQSDPRDVPTLVALLRARRADMVNGVRARRRDGLVRRISSRVANGFRNWLTRESVTDVGCSVRVMRREVVRHLLVFRGMHRFLPTLARLNGAETILEVPVNHRPRLRGRTKYGVGNRLWVGLADAFAVRWLQARAVRARVTAAGAARAAADDVGPARREVRA
jgi:glycosyltransferase involved in cell wall biosynthesis